MKLQKWGNSAAVRFPKEIISQLGLKIGDELETQAQGDTIVIRAAKRRRYTLAQLLAETPETAPRVAGWEEMAEVGKEVAE
ncbi:AbrB/MazE/SpoVT family DNA-binding domain-containing protein [Neisseria sp. ZJ106]|uniref:AbrB/MazE/SpoVT family DNA-binding domain-containing protein n=1 Tax=Neisseria lisongii TaxID=2912188 RepID=A0ABY7RIZ0_9NEIS|nr:AbrB/MazE/SpoVT family DNA-binding domain-containing protein [Neisseria lisongii]MCF7520940.1 AbrB/MazE/SpoVT family DNA-binding domain-containing protein [Neisseria lisongii]WCL71257.1 AbrB/MazE/SpoVT family DNA-binding domain-containing protein [Neisseria lisongii]